MRILIGILLILTTLVLFSCQKQNKTETAHKVKTQVTSSHVSNEKKKLLAAIQSGKKNGNNVLIKIGAAWCSPCAVLDKTIKSNPEEFKRITSKFEFISFEHYHWHALSGTMDFMPSYDVAFFPSLFIYNVTTGKWSYFATTEIGDLEQELNDYHNTGGTSSKYLEKSEILLQTAAANAEGTLFDFAESWDNTDIFFQTVMRIAYERPGAEAFSHIIKVQELIEREGFQGTAQNFLLGVVQKGYQILVARGELDSDMALAMIKSDDVEGIYRVGFTGELAHQLHSKFENYKKCSTLQQKYVKTNEKAAVDSANASIKKIEEKITGMIAQLNSDENKDNTQKQEQIKEGIQKERKNITWQQQYWRTRKLKSQIVCHLIGAQNDVSGIGSKIMDTYNEINGSDLLQEFQSNLLTDLSYALASSGDFETALPLVEARKVRRVKQLDSDKEYWLKEVENLEIKLYSLQLNLKKQKQKKSDSLKIIEIETAITATQDRIDLYRKAVVRTAHMQDRVTLALDQLKLAWSQQTTIVKK